MAGISSISDIFRKDDDGEYIKSNARLAQKILSYTLVNRKGDSSQTRSEIFYDRDLARWLLNNYHEFVNHYQRKRRNQMKESNKIENVRFSIRSDYNKIALECFCLDCGQFVYIAYDLLDYRKRVNSSSGQLGAISGKCPGCSSENSLILASLTQIVSRVGLPSK